MPGSSYMGIIKFFVPSGFIFAKNRYKVIFILRATACFGNKQKRPNQIGALRVG